ncbi:MAG: flagellar hook-length control protein FliK [Candidatus Puniceispirillaceae bacterium]
MNTMEALGAGPALSPKGETPGLNLGADAETLALFASLFAMMQNPQPDGAETAASSLVTQSQPDVTDSTPLLPAAAMLMASLAPSVEVANPDIAVSGDVAGDAASGDIVPGDAAGLLKLLLAAHDITAPDHQPTAPTPAPAPAADSDAGIVPAAPTRTATEMLTGAIEILKSLGAASAEDVPAVADDALPKEPAPMVMVPPSNDFIGPMPAMTQAATAMPATVTTAMPATVTTAMPAAVTTAVTTVIAAPSPDFVGPMPAVRSAAAVSNGVPNSVTPSLNAAPETGRPGRVDQLVKHELPKAMMDQAGDTGDDGSVHRRADIQAAVKGMTESAASQNKPAEIQGLRQQITQARSDAGQNAAPSNSAAMQGLVQQLASSSNGGNPLSAVNGQDSGQNLAANATASTAGGQSGNHAGGHSGNQSGGQQAAQQMVDGGPARGAADRTILHRLNTDNAGWSETMVKRLTADLRSGVQNVRIILEPRQLGRLNVELGLRNGKASIRIATETQEAARLLSGARAQLGQMLESAGMRLASFQATGSHGGDTGLDTGQGSQNRGGEGAGDNTGRNNTGRNQDFSNKMSTTLEDHNDDQAAGDNALREGETAVLSILA